MFAVARSSFACDHRLEGLEAVSFSRSANLPCSKRETPRGRRGRTCSPTRPEQPGWPLRPGTARSGTKTAELGLCGSEPSISAVPASQRWSRARCLISLIDKGGVPFSATFRRCRFVEFPDGQSSRTCCDRNRSSGVVPDGGYAPPLRSATFGTWPAGGSRGRFSTTPTAAQTPRSVCGAPEKPSPEWSSSRESCGTFPQSTLRQ